MARNKGMNRVLEKEMRTSFAQTRRSDQGKAGGHSTPKNSRPHKTWPQSGGDCESKKHELTVITFTYLGGRKRVGALQKIERNTHCTWAKGEYKLGNGVDPAVEKT